MRAKLILMFALILGLTALVQTPSAKAEAFYAVTANGIFSVDGVSGGPATQLVTFAAPLTLAATLAIRPSDGMLFYLDSGNANPGLWRWDPANPATLPVFVGTPGATTTNVVRLAFDAAGTLFAVDTNTTTLWTLDPSTGAILNVVPTSGDAGLVPGGGDICLHPTTGVLYMVAGQQLFTLTNTGVVTQLGAMTGLPGNATGCAFDRNGRLVVSPGTTLYSVNVGSLAATPLPVDTGVAAIGDLATAPGRVADLNLTKTASNLTPGNTVSFTITVTNSGPARTTDVRVLDVLPAGLTFVSAAATQGAYSTTAIAAPLNLPAGTWRVGTLNVGATATLTINANVTVGTPVTNTAQVSHSDLFDPDSTPNNSVVGEDDQASVTITPSPDLRIVKVATTTFAVGVNGIYTLSVNNLLGSLASSGNYTVIDNMPTGLTIVGVPTGTGWNCAASTATQLSCISSTVMAAGASNPNAITLTVLPGAAAAPSVTNTATVSGGGEIASNSGNNSSTITTTVCTVSCPDLIVNKTLSVASLTVGVSTSIYTLSVSNVGGQTTGANPYTITDTLPTGLTLAAAPTAGAGWVCTANAPAAGDNVSGGGRVVCTRGTAIPAGATSTTMTFPVNVANTTVPSVTNTASVTGGGEPSPSATGNNSTSLVTPVIDFDLTVTKTATSTFAVGANATYSIVVNNIGGRTTTNTSAITVTDTLPAGLTFVSGAGTGWNACTAAGQVVTCVRPAANTIANSASAPAITLTVAVVAAAAPSVSNTATVSKPDEAAASTGNNASTVITPVNAPDLIVSKSHNGNFTVGTNGVYTITVVNIGASITSALVTVTDTLPAGLTFVSGAGTGWTACTAVGQVVTCTRAAGNTIAANTAAPPITLTVAVAAAAATASPVTNNVSVAGGGEPAGNNGNNTDADITAVFFSPTIAKAFLPTTIAAGATSVLTLTIANPAGNGVSLAGVAVVDPFPAGMSVAPTPAFTNTCGGVITSGNAPGDTQIALTGGGPVAPGASCIVRVTVTSTATGTNTTGQVSSTNSGTGNTSSATLTVTAPGSPVLSKLSDPNPVGVNQLSTLTFTIVNKATATNDMAFTDTFPAGVVYRGTGAGGTCTSTGGTAFALTNQAGAALVAGTSTGIRAVGIDLVGSASCTIIISVSSATPGNYANINANITGLLGGLTANVNDTLVVQGTTLTKAFTPSTVAIGQSSNLTFTITNGAGTPGQGGLVFTETLPAGVVIASVVNATQCSGTATGAVGGSTITLAGGAMVLGQTNCTITVAVSSNAVGTYNNLPANVTGLSAGMTNNATATLTVNLGVALTVTKTLITVCDPLNFNNNPKAIPGAYVRYEIKIENGPAAVTSATLTTIADALDPNLNFDPDLRTGSAGACATSPPEGAAGQGFKLTCTGGTRACNTPVFFTTVAGDDAMGIVGSNLTLTFGDGAGARALPTEPGYTPGQLKPGESVTIRFNTIVK